MLGAQLKILEAPVPTEKQNLLETLLHHLQFFVFYYNPVYVVLTSKADILFV